MTMQTVSDQTGLITFDACFDATVIGICERYGAPDTVAYDKKKFLENLINEGFTYDEAVIYQEYEFKTHTRWCGEKSPCFINRLVEVIGC